MASKFFRARNMKKEVKKALARAKELEKHNLPSKGELAKRYKEVLEQARKLNKLLKPEDFLSCSHKNGHQKRAKKKASTTRKKKSL
ncbi:hypothetical protein D6825_04180 [Candidatus Woesearchaeota archaeon]|nr:MAG: hypothetical protein D6825_04180 [Candidatus Woesearchaeota archaeon]